VYGTFDTASSAFTLTSQGFVNAIGLMIMMVYSQYLGFDVPNYIDSGYITYLDNFWYVVNS
jgi:hypothetical protein